MSIRNAGKIIREARKKSGLTLERLSEDICTTQSLCRIEKGQAGVSQGTFAALMEKTGYPSTMLPEFESMDDFECFNHLNYASFHLNACNIKEAISELQEVEKLSWNHNQFYYQKWLLLEIQLQFLSFQTDHDYLFTIIEKALSLTCPNLNLDSFQNRLLTISEMELLLLLANVYLDIEKTDQALSICSQINLYISNCNLSLEEKDILMAKYAIVYTQYLYKQARYQEAYQLADEYRNKMILYHNNTLLLLLSFITSISQYQLGQKENAFNMFHHAFYSAHALKSHLATYFLHTFEDLFQIEVSIDQSIFPEINIQIDMITLPEIEDFDNGFFESSHTNVTFGTLIQNLRISKNISQQQLCDGLCSKSKLSKIENGTLQADTILAETLLQRLGISEREFVFCGNAEEEKYHSLKYQNINYHNLMNNQENTELHMLMNSSFTKNPIYKQLAFFSSVPFLKTYEEKMDCLYEALTCTTPSFDSSSFSAHLFSWAELSILNNIAFNKGLASSPLDAITLFQKILEYKKQHELSIIFESQIYGVTLSLFAHFLSHHSYDSELYQFFLNEDHSIASYNLGILAEYYLYASQSIYIKSSDHDKIKYTYYAYALNNIMGHIKTASLYREAFKQFAHIDIEY